jgi:hypothetical protein
MRRKWNIVTEILCSCGHIKEQHTTVGQFIVAPVYLPFCHAQIVTINGQHADICRCSGYKPDNLMHIERLARERNLI